MIEIISHCFGPRYASLLNYHLSSLVLRESKMITMTVIYIATDDATKAVLEYFKSISKPWIKWNFIPMVESLVYQRPIGRNIAAKLTKADIVWFADSDHAFGDGCLDALYQLPDGDAVYHPDMLMACNRGAFAGMLAAVKTPCIIDVDRSKFRPITMWKAVGGVQIVSGDTARKFGYLPDSETWQKPLDKYQRDDGSAFWREQFKQLGKLSIPNVYRIQ